MTKKTCDETALQKRSAIGWFDSVVRFIDQRRLPQKLEIIETDDWRVIASAIQTLAIRGAPLIGVAASMAVAACAVKSQSISGSSMHRRLLTAINGLRSTRPTAYNLFWALDRMQLILESYDDKYELARQLVKESTNIHDDDRERCARIGANGAEVIPDGGSVLTVCNAGFLATGGMGTALATIYAAVDAGNKLQVYAPETRPLLQGARLTMWEMSEAGIPATLLVDSAVAPLVAKGRVDVCIIGADRIASNGDTANKIGSYQIALACHRHRVPFYVAAPLSTVDFDSATGNDITIEHRSNDEVTHVGKREIAPSGVQVWNPAFDIVPAELIAGIITENGVQSEPFDFKSHL